MDSLVPQPARAKLQLAATPAQAADALRERAALNSVQRIEYAILSSGDIVIKVGLKNKLPSRPAGFTVYHPAAHIALDLPNTTNELGKKTIAVNQGTLRSVHVVQVGTHTRLVMDLFAPASYDTALEGNSLLITLRSPAAP